MGSSGSTDTYHPKTVWMSQGATHLRCSSGAEVKIAPGGKLRDSGDANTTGAAQSTTLNPWGTYAIDTSGVYEVNPVRGSVCTIHVHSTAYIFFKATSEISPTRFPTSKMRVLKVAASSEDNMRWGPGFQIRGMTTARAYVSCLGGFSSDKNDTHLVIIETSST